MNRSLALAVEGSIMQCLANAYEDPESEERWRAHADKLERKFTTQFGRHYSYFTQQEDNSNQQRYLP